MSAISPESYPEFCFVDTAVGGANRRNNVMRMDEFDPAPDAVDVFMTGARYPVELQQHAITNSLVPPTKRPSVRGYAGQAVSDALLLDFDDAADPSRAQRDVQAALAILIDTHGVPPAHLRLGFSGKKGFWMEIPAELFGGLYPMVGLHHYHKALAKRLFPRLVTMDLGIYTALRLIRCVNTRHSGSGLYKIALTVDEVENSSLSDIRTLAKAPR